MSHLQTFLDRVERFLDAAGMSPTAFGKAALSDPNFVFDLREGRIPNLKVVDRVEAFIVANEPSDDLIQPAPRASLPQSITGA